MLLADTLYVKGARAYELLGSGIRKPAFFAQTVSREFSESITGIDARASVTVLLFSHVFPSFWGFRRRHSRNGTLWPTGRQDWMVSMSSRESVLHMKTTRFQEDVARKGIEQCSNEIMQKSIESDIPPHVVLTEHASNLKK